MSNPLTDFNSGATPPQSQEAALWQEVNRIFASFERTAFARELTAVFQNLQDIE